MKAEDLIGTYEVSTVQDIADVFSLMRPRARRGSYVRLCVGDDLYEVYDLEIAQSDQAEDYELKVYIRAHPQAS